MGKAQVLEPEKKADELLVAIGKLTEAVDRVGDGKLTEAVDRVGDALEDLVDLIETGADTGAMQPRDAGAAILTGLMNLGQSAFGRKKK